MKPTTEQIAYIRRDAERVLRNGHDLSWSEAADMARFVLDTTADPTPMPAPALGMRVWIEAVAVTSGTAYTASVDVREILPDSGPMRWDAVVRDPDTITIITDFRTGEVLWRR